MCSSTGASADFPRGMERGWRPVGDSLQSVKQTTGDLCCWAPQRQWRGCRKEVPALPRLLVSEDQMGSPQESPVPGTQVAQTRSHIWEQKVTFGLKILIECQGSGGL